jgi:hypothetical protein
MTDESKKLCQEYITMLQMILLTLQPLMKANILLLETRSTLSLFRGKIFLFDSEKGEFLN